MTNRDIARRLRLTAKLMEIVQENPFKTKAYDKAADAIKGYATPLVLALGSNAPPDIEGVGKGIWGAITELLQTGTFGKLEELRAQIPEGIVELSEVRGIGPKKLHQLWKEAGIDSADALMRACEDGSLSRLKGFGEKTQAVIYNGLLYHAGSKGKLHLNTADEISSACLTVLAATPGIVRVEVAGDLRRQLPEVSELVFVAEYTRTGSELVGALTAQGHLLAPSPLGDNVLVWTLEDNQHAQLHICVPDRFVATCIRLSSSAEHWSESGLSSEENYANEASAYGSVGLPWLPAEVRDGRGEIAAAREGNFPEQLVQREDIQGVVHAHSTYSDGANTLREMAEACIALGYNYLCITDHSQTAAYAGGLKPDRVREQHTEIDKLNRELTPFRIFKGIESDILRDGSLDYTPDVLASFDFVIGSIHQHFQMSEAEATERIVRALANPFLTILGHPTGRLLLNRAGYPINHQRVIEAAAEHGVCIELNCNPWRLDLDWTWIREATRRGVPIALSPDAHSIADISYMDYGIRVGRKGWLTASQTLNARPFREMEAYFAGRKERATR